MATAAAMNHAASRRLYSWWWDSHISPKNSKWLQENLSDIDDKVKSMIRIIEEDAESFAQRAEMFYRNRPELMKSVEEFYRAYRALAERYDHATGALRQAHRKITEAFPNEIPFEFPEESPGSFSTLFEPDGLQHEFLLVPRDDAFINSHNEGASSEYKSLKEEVSQLHRDKQDLKNQVSLESLRADTAESEILDLKETLAKVKADKEHALSRYEECRSRLSHLENELSRYQSDTEKLKDDMLRRDKSLSNAEEKSLALEKANQSLNSELGMLKQKIKANQSLNFELELLRKKMTEQQEELDMKKEEVRKLQISLKDEQQCRMLSEITRRSVDKSLTGISRLSLEEELQKFKEENGRLNEEKLLSALKVINLQDEIISQKDLANKLKDTLDVHSKEKTSLQHELCRLKEDRKDLEERYNVIREEIQSVNSNIQSLPAMIKDLKDKKLELRDNIEEHEEKEDHLQCLQLMEEMSVKNAKLQNSISDANKELEKLREKIKTLENSSYHLHGRISIYQAEKAILISQSESLSQKIEELSKKNVYLENSLYDATFELDDLKGKLKSLEESYRSLRNDNSTLLSENTTLVSQVESISQSLKNLENDYAEIQLKYDNAETQKNSAIHQVAELQELLGLEKEEHSALIQKSKLQLETFMMKVQILQGGGQKREKELEVEQLQMKKAQTIIFALQRCFSNIKEEMVLSAEFQKHQGTLRFIESLVLDLEHEFLSQEKNIKSLAERNEKLRELIHLIAKLLKLDLEIDSLADVDDELLLHLISSEIRHLLHAIAETQDEKQQILLEKSVVITLLEQIGAYVSDLREKLTALEKEPCRTEDFQLLKCKNEELLQINEQLREEVQARNQREEALKAEVDILFWQQSHVQNAYCLLQIEFPKMLEQKCQLEEENRVILAEAVGLDYLCLMLKSCIAEKVSELQALSDERNFLFNSRNDLDVEIQQMSEKIVMLEAKNAYMKESVTRLEGKNLLAFQDESTIHGGQHAPAGKRFLLDKDLHLSKANHCLLRAAYHPDGLNQDYPAENVTRDEIEKEMSILAENILCKEKENQDSHFYNQVLSDGELRLQKDVEDTRMSGIKLASEAQKRMNEVKFSDADINLSLNDIQFTTINAEFSKAKIQELIKTCQSFERTSMVQKNVLEEEITVRDLAINELKQKAIALEGENRELMAYLNAYLILLRSLWDDVSILEEHTISLASRHSTSTNHFKEDFLEKKFPTKSNQESSEHDSAMTLSGLEKLQTLQAKVKSLQKVVMDTEGLLELERLDSNASFDAAWKEVEWLTSRRITNGMKIKRGEIMKDVLLDDSSDSSRQSSSVLPYELKKTISITEISDPVLEISDTNKMISSRKKEKRQVETEENGISHYRIGNVEADEYPSLEVVAEKELGVDKLVLPKKLESNQEWSRIVRERLAYDGHRLLILQAHLRELEKNIEAFQNVSHLNKYDADSVKLRLQETEKTISKLIDINSKLARKVDSLSRFPDNEAKEKKDSSRKSQQISERAMKVSQKIGKLEQELQKIQSSFVKADEEHSSNLADKKSGTLQKEYISAKRESHRQKKGSSCGCMRPKTIDD